MESLRLRRTRMEPRILDADVDGRWPASSARSVGAMARDSPSWPPRWPGSRGSATVAGRSVASDGGAAGVVNGSENGDRKAPLKAHSHAGTIVTKTQTAQRVASTAGVWTGASWPRAKNPQGPASDTGFLAALKWKSEREPEGISQTQENANGTENTPLQAGRATHTVEQGHNLSNDQSRDIPKAAKTGFAGGWMEEGGNRELAHQ